MQVAEKLNDLLLQETIYHQSASKKIRNVSAI
jgi:hypothetical protein